MNRSSAHFPGFEVLIRRLEDGIFRYEKNYIPVVYGFLGLESIPVIESCLNSRVPYSLLGGYDEALRFRLVIGDDLNPGDYITCISASYRKEFGSLSHRDVLGALMNQGIDETQHGDLWVDEDRIYIYTTTEMAAYLKENLKQIGRMHVRFEELDYFPAQTFRFREKQHVLSSYRLDRIVAACIQKSRGKAQNLIQNGMVNVNFLCVEDSDHLCHNGDILSIRGTGRFKIGDEIAETRSGNIVVVIKQFV